MLAVAQEWRLIAHVPAIKWMRVPKPRFDFLRFDEASRLLAAVDEDWRAMVTVAVRTGLRQGELLALRWDEVDLNARKLTVRFSAWKGKIGSPKSGRARELPLTPETVALLSKLCRRESGFVFCKADGSPFTKGECKHPLWRACRTAGLRRIGWHVLRHTFASHLVMRGVPLKAVQELMGHATIEMTMRYAHLSPEMRTDSVDLLDRPPPVQGNGNLTTTGQGGVTM
jgi:integrase